MAADSDHGHYRIGAVARMTGIALPTLRMWERRYGVVKPLRTPAGGRLYTREHVARLALLQAAVQAGHAIGTVAALRDDDIRRRLRDASVARHTPTGGGARLVVVGPGLPVLMGRELADPALQVAATFSDVAAARAGLAPLTPDVLLVEVPTLHPDEVEPLCQLIEQSEARLCIVAYGFTGRRILRRLDLLNVLCVRAPADLTQLMRICRLAIPRLAAQRDNAGAQTVAARRFSDQQLLQVASLDPTLRCECPQHLASLISSLAAFERYSQQCGAASPEDARLHERLYRTTATARYEMEQVLLQVLHADGFDLEALGLTTAEMAVSVIPDSPH